MHELPLLREIDILLAATILTSIVFYYLRFPTIIGYIIGGVIIGPYGIGLISEVELIDTMAEIGVVLLLFTIGIEFSISEIMKVGTRGLMTALMQIFLTTLAVVGLLSIFDVPLTESFLLGFVITMSSTAVVLRLFMDRGDMESPQGRISLGVLLTQDMAIVPMVLIIQVLGGGQHASLMDIWRTVGLSIMAVATIIVMSYYIVPVFLHQIVRLKSPEVLTMAGIFACLSTAWVSAHFGLSLALGAFIAGVVIAESEYSHQITASVLPFRDIFSSIFFISIGMLISLDAFASQWEKVILLALTIIIAKAVLITAVAFVMRYPLRIAFIVGLTLAQIGEFSFVLLEIGKDLMLVGENLYQVVLSSTVISMIATPLLIKFAPAISHRLPNIMLNKGDELAGMDIRSASAINHVIIAGYGLVGRHLSNVLKKTGIPCVVLDINHENVKRARKDGHIGYYGDTSYTGVLKSAGITAAKVMVFAISDPVGTRRGINIAREINPGLHIIARTKYMGEISELSRAGANQVIPEEFETSVEIFSRVLKEYKVPVNIIQNQVDLVRLEGYSMLRGMSLSAEKITEVSALLAASVSENYYVKEGGVAAGKSLKELNLRGRGGATVIATVRGDRTRTNPPADYVIQNGDILVLLGSHGEIASALDILDGGDEKNPINS